LHAILRSLSLSKTTRRLDAGIMTGEKRGPVGKEQLTEGRYKIESVYTHHKYMIPLASSIQMETITTVILL
jgi:hypothetical protein